MKEPVPRSSSKTSASGMTMVEMMVTLGIASAMMLAITDIIQLSSRTTQNVATVSAWNAQISAIQQAINSQQGCTDAVTLANPGITFTQAGTDGQGNNPVNQIVSYNTATNPGTGLPYNTPISTVATQGTYYNNHAYAINNNNVAAAPPATPPNHSMGISLLCPGTNCLTNTTKVFIGGVSTPFNVYSAQLVVNGTKQSAVAGGKQLGSQQLAPPNGGIPITLLVYQNGANVNQIYQCYGANATESTICEGLGGVWQTNDNSCIISSIQFYSDGNAGVLNNPSPPGGLGPFGSPQFSPSSPNAYDTMNGERIQLYGTPGAPSSTDAAIGVGGPGVANQWTGSSDPYMWFNVGGGGAATFDFHSQTTAGYDHDHMELGDLFGNGQSFLVVDPLPYMSNEPNGTAAQFYLGGWYYNNSYSMWMEGPGFSYSGYGPDPTSGANGMMWWAQASLPFFGLEMFYLPRAVMDAYGTLNILPNWTYDWNGPPGQAVLAFSDLSGLPGGYNSGEWVVSDRSVPDLELWAGSTQMVNMESTNVGNVVFTPNTGMGGAFVVNGWTNFNYNAQIYGPTVVTGGELADWVTASNTISVYGSGGAGGNVFFGPLLWNPNGPLNFNSGAGGAAEGSWLQNWANCPAGYTIVGGACDCSPTTYVMNATSEFIPSGQKAPNLPAGFEYDGPLWFCDCRAYQNLPPNTTITMTTYAMCAQQ